MNLIRYLATFAAAVCFIVPPSLSAGTIISARHRINGFAIGCQAWTFKEYTAFEAIEKTAEAGGKVIEFYPGQKFSKERPDLKLDHNLSNGDLASLLVKLKLYHLQAVNYGVVKTTGEENWRKVFKFAKSLGLYGITTESVEELDLLEKLAKEYKIHVGIHEHARRDNDPSYKLWDPNYVLSLVKDRAPWVGACADTGHWQSSYLEPLDCIKILSGHIISVHLKDRSEKGPGGHDVPYGTGVNQIKQILDELNAQKFDGNISVEYEYNWTNSVPDVKKCIDFVRNY